MSTARSPAPAPDEAATRTWLSVVRAYHLCDALMARSLAPLGVRTAEHEVLANLRREPGLSQQALASRCFTAKSHISALLGALEQRGWLRREGDPADARVKRLYLEPAGERIAERTGQVQAQVVALMTEGAPAADLDFVLRVMGTVSTRLEAALARAA